MCSNLEDRCIFSVFKANLKRRLHSISHTVSYQQRREILINSIASSFEMESTMVENFYRHSASFNAKAIAREDILGD